MASASSVSKSILRQACFFDQIEASSSEHVASRTSSETQQLLVLQAQGVYLRNCLIRARIMWWSKFCTFKSMKDHWIGVKTALRREGCTMVMG